MEKYNINIDLKLPFEQSSVVARERTLVSIVVAIVGEAGRGVGEDRLYRLRRPLPLLQPTSHRRLNYRRTEYVQISY